MRGTVNLPTRQSRHPDVSGLPITSTSASHHQRWVSLIQSARYKRQQGSIDCALLDYDSAFRIADQCLRTEKSIVDAAGRYLVSTAEMLYSLRLAGYREDMQQLLQCASKALETTQLPFLQTRMSALQAIVSQPLGLIEYWLCHCQGLLSTD